MAKRATRGSAFQYAVLGVYANKRAAKKQHEGYSLRNRITDQPETVERVYPKLCANSNVGAKREIGPAIFVVDCKLSVDHAPINTPSGPFSRNIHHRQIQHFQKTVIGWKDRLRFRYFSKLPVESFNVHSMEDLWQGPIECTA